MEGKSSSSADFFLKGGIYRKLIEKHRPSAGDITNLLRICDSDLEKVPTIELGRRHIR
jgi:hypothetical protein